MPIYCYKCFNCNHYEEIKQSFDDRELTHCPQCHQEQFKRVIRGVGVIFKGKGFHVNDYGGKKPAPVSSSDAETKTPEKPRTDTPPKSSEAKPEKKESAVKASD